MRRNAVQTYITNAAWSFANNKNSSFLFGRCLLTIFVNGRMINEKKYNRCAKLVRALQKDKISFSLNVFQKVGDAQTSENLNSNLFFF